MDNYEIRFDKMMNVLNKIGWETLDLNANIRLRDMGFLHAPASTRFHGNYEGGLFDHSHAMVEILCDFTEFLKLEWSRPESPFIIGLFHDLCKADAYKLENSDPPKYSHVDTILKGHGEKSVMIASTLLRLTEEEVYCIRFHMGAFNHEEMNEYSRAVEKFPNVLWTHTADMIASKIIGV